MSIKTYMTRVGCILIKVDEMDTKSDQMNRRIGYVPGAITGHDKMDKNKNNG